MDKFGPHWQGHALRIQEAWDALVKADDIVLCPGDLSWAMRLDEAQKDLEWIGNRPGLKILGRGNHDYWWSSIGKVRAQIPKSCVALQNDAYDLGEVVVAGSRCWSAPGTADFTPEDQKIYERELLRLRMSLEAAKKMASGRPLIAAIHYPPFTTNGSPTGYAQLMEEFGVAVCVYGHLHDERSHRNAVQGQVNGTTYHLIACDFLRFTPKLIWPQDLS